MGNGNSISMEKWEKQWDVAAVAVEVNMRRDVAVACSPVIGILFRESMHNNRWLYVLLFPQFVLFLLVPGTTFWHSEDHGFAGSQKCTEEREGYDMFSPTSLPTIRFLLSWQCWEYVLGSSGKLKKNKQRAETVTQAVWSSQKAAVRFAQSFKSWAFWERWCLWELLNCIILRMKIVLQRCLQPICRTPCLH